MKLHTNKELFNDLIEATAQHMNILPIYIEKDYWVCYILKSLSLSEYADKAIFKGGTSLSKAYKIIERFSEDIDLAIISNGLSGNEIKNLIKKIEEDILDDNFVEISTSQTSKGSQFRKTVHQYPKIKDGLFGHANENIIVELNSFAKPSPFGKKTISSYISDFLQDSAASMIEEYDLQSFEVNVLDLKRTLCEKISAISRASYESDENLTQLKEKIRHFYDIYFLLQEKEILEFLDTQEFVQIIENVKNDDKGQFGNQSWTSVKLCQTPIFLDSHELLKKLNDFYTENFAELVYGNDLPSIEAIHSELEKIANILKIKKL